MNADIRTSWNISGADLQPAYGPGRSEEDFKKHAELVQQVASIGQQKRWTKDATAKKIGMPAGTFSQWFSGKYNGRFDTHNAEVERWLATLENNQAIERAIPNSPPFLNTKIAGEMLDMMRSAKLLPTLNMITADAGIGKTMAAEHMIEIEPNCWLVTISPHTKTIHGMLLAIAETIGISQPNQAKLVSSVGARIARRGASTLLIVDEAQNLTDDAINQLRHFVDVYKVGVALLGNNESYSRFAAWGEGVKYGQLRRRIFKRLNKRTPYQQDLKMLIKAWNITDPDIEKYLIGIGNKPGAMGQIDMTLKLATMIAMGQDREFNLADIKSAFKNRDVEK